MNLNNEEYKVLRKKTEKKLKDYPYYIMSIEMPDLRGGTDFGEVTSKTNKFSSSVENSVMDLDYMKNIVKAIDYVLERLDDMSRRIIETAYFRDDIDKEDVQSELMIDRNKYYRLKKKAVEKFMIVLR